MEGIFIRDQSGHKIIYCRNIILEAFDDRNDTYAIIEERGDSEILLGEYSEEKAEKVMKRIWRNIADNISVYDMPTDMYDLGENK